MQDRGSTKPLTGGTETAVFVQVPEDVVPYVDRVALIAGGPEPASSETVHEVRLTTAGR